MLFALFYCIICNNEILFKNGWKHYPKKYKCIECLNLTSIVNQYLIDCVYSPVFSECSIPPSIVAIYEHAFLDVQV